MGIMNSPLLASKTVKCCFMTKAVVLDAVGGYKVTWAKGAEFDAVLTEDSSTQAVVAGIEHSTTFFGVKVDVDVPLEFADVFMRLKDGATFRVRTSDGMDAPSISTLGIKMRQAEKYALTET